MLIEPFGKIINMKKVVVLGGLGMAGHVLVEQLKQKGKYEVHAVARNQGQSITKILDVSDFNSLEAYLTEIKPDYVVNCVGVLVKGSNDDICNSIALNSYLPNFLARVGNKINYKLIHISTDCVFSGDDGGYTESSYRDGDTNYARTKTLGEVINDRDITIRTSIIGPELKLNGTGLMHWFLNQIDTVNGYSNAFWSGVTTVELGKYILEILESNITGLVHLCPEGKISKLDLLKEIDVIFNKNIGVNPYDDYHCDKSLLSTRDDQKFIPLNYHDMLVETKKWIDQTKFYYYS